MKTKQEKRQEIESELKKMKVGFCGIKYDCLVWRISETQWQVGQQSLSLENDSMPAEEAAIYMWN